MTCLKTTFYTFRCDEGDCPATIEYEAKNQRRAEQMARDDGWASHPGGDRCPTHNRNRLPECDNCGAHLLDPERPATTVVCPMCGEDAEAEASA